MRAESGGRCGDRQAEGSAITANLKLWIYCLIQFVHYMNSVFPTRQKMTKCHSRETYELQELLVEVVVSGDKAQEDQSQTPVGVSLLLSNSSKQYRLYL